jgi:hypothetical protein
MSDWQTGLLIALLVSIWMSNYFQAKRLEDVQKKIQVLENMLDVITERIRR